ncbi:DUF2637 domain-containing protein [Streptomyces gobiensis]|uniref:DUF2637 domain-containing protein n=1 Tax=Streptomyces gobiensis TaxID=2875706 RepID=UPI001E4A20F5|nr:DUF2637 domain-containing protein [Streptomyces gobiensis]UGY92915.1 DUF2637 domain-containing protein [Streptomyces gobiensis]
MSATQLNRTHRILIGVVIMGAVVIAAIGFAGSYSAVRDLAERKGFGAFAPFFPIGIDAGIVVLLALDLLLTWLRIGFPLLRQTAWLLTAATIAFNGAAAWPDPLGVGMHAVIPILFVVSVEAARHAIGRIADITADKHMEGVRLSRWLLAFPSTFRLWRRMKLWELRSYDEVIRLEQDRLVYQARLRARFGRAWRRRAPVEALMPLKLARYGIPLAETAPAGLAAAGITLPRPQPTPIAEPTPAPEPEPVHEPEPEPQPQPAFIPHQTQQQPEPPVTVPVGPGGRRRALGQAAPEQAPEDNPIGIPDGEARDEVYFGAYRSFIAEQGSFPSARQLSRVLHERSGVTNSDGTLLSEGYLRPYLREFRERYNAEMGVAG